MMSRISRNEPFDLNRRRESHASWFDRARSTLNTKLSTLFSTPPMVVVTRPGEMKPWSAGAIVGGVGGAVMLATATLAAHRTGSNVDIAATIGSVVTRGALVGTPAFALGVVFAIATGGLIGALFAIVTRRLRRLAPLVAFGLIVATSAWVVVHAIALRHFAPWLARAIPIAPMLVGAAVFGLILAMQLPLRTRRL